MQQAQRKLLDVYVVLGDPYPFVRYCHGDKAKQIDEDESPLNIVEAAINKFFIVRFPVIDVLLRQLEWHVSKYGPSNELSASVEKADVGPDHQQQIEFGPHFLMLLGGSVSPHEPFCSPELVDDALLVKLQEVCLTQSSVHDFRVILK